jgi:hypothetical protein
MGWVVTSASRCKAAALPTSNSSHTRQSGRQPSTILNDIQVANASLSHRSSHHAMVTRLPNHWWASSWVMTSATRFWVGRAALAERDEARVLHGPGLEVRHRDLVELAERIGQAEVLLQPRQHGQGHLLGERGEVDLLRHRPGAHRDGPHALLGGSQERPDRQGDEVGGQRRGAREADCAAAVRGLLPLGQGVGEGDLVRGHRERERPGGLERGLVEAGEDAARVGGLELGDRQRPSRVQASQARGEGTRPGEA